MGSKNTTYKDDVQPHLEEIATLAETLTQKQIAETLGISETTLYSYKKKYPEFAKALKKGHFKVVKELRSTLIQRAKGGMYTEKKSVIKDGVTVAEEVYERYMPPDVAAINLCLKNYDKENWANDPQHLEIKQRELELKESEVKERKACGELAYKLLLQDCNDTDVDKKETSSEND